MFIHIVGRFGTCTVALMLSLSLWVDTARADFYIAPSVGIGLASSQINTRAFWRSVPNQRSLSPINADIGLGIGRRSQIWSRTVDFELEARISATGHHQIGTRHHVIGRQQISLAAYTTVLRRKNIHAQLGLGASVRRLNLSVVEGANRRSDIDREPFGMIVLRGIWNSRPGVNRFAELRYSVHPAPRRGSTGAAIEHQMDQLGLYFGVKFDLPN